MVVFVVKQYAVMRPKNGGMQYAKGRGVSPSSMLIVL